MPDFSKMAASYKHIFTPNAPHLFVSLPYIASTYKSVVSVMNLVGSRLNQRKLAVSERKSDVIPSETWMRKDVVV